MKNYVTTFHVTLHCLTGCMLGEFLGLAIAISLGWSLTGRIVLAVVMAFICGLGLAIYSLMRRENVSWQQALNVVWLGEVVSISVMEVAMNVTDYHMGGLQVASLGEALFWWGLLGAGVAGFIAAYPVNMWLLARHLKKCH